MRGRPATRGGQLRALIAREAARLMVEGGVRDYQVAKRKAAQQLQALDGAQLPRNDEIEAAVSEYQRLFRADSQPRHLASLRRVALEAMRFLDAFHPRLVGPVLRGTADEHTPVSLHLFAEPAEEVGLFLGARGIPHELAERRLRIGADEFRVYPAITFIADDVSIELVLFPLRARGHPPLSPVDGRPMRRAGTAEVERLAAD